MEQDVTVKFVDPEPETEIWVKVTPKQLRVLVLLTGRMMYSSGIYQPLLDAYRKFTGRKAPHYEYHIRDKSTELEISGIEIVKKERPYGR